MKMPKKVTTEDLAKMMAKGFENIATKDDLVREASSIRQDIDRLELRIGHLAYAFEVKDLKKRLDVVERKLKVK